MSVAREQPPVEKIVRPFQDFAHKQSSGGILLMVATGSESSKISAYSATSP